MKSNFRKILYGGKRVCDIVCSDDFPESTGVKRIIQALNANVWSSVEMKDGEL